MNDKNAKYQGLIDLMLTTDDVVKFGEEIDTLVKSLYHIEDGEFEEKLAKDVRVRVAGEIRKLLGKDVGLDKDVIKSVLTGANSVVSNLPTLKLLLAFEPSEVVIESISSWSRANLEKGLVIEWSMDRNILGGAVIIYRGKFYDFSVKKKLQEIFDKGLFNL